MDSNDFWTGRHTLLLLIALCLGDAFVPSAFSALGELSAIKRSLRPSLTVGHLVEPSALPEPATAEAIGQGLISALGLYIFSPNGFGIAGVAALAIRLNTYFTTQSMAARLLALFAQEGTTIELSYGNGLRNLNYYENKMEKLIVPTGDKRNIDVSRQIIAKLQARSRNRFNIMVLEEDFDDLQLSAGSIDTIVSTYMLSKRKDPARSFERAMRLLKDGGRFVFLEPILGGPLAPLRRLFGQVHRATGAFGDPSLDFKGIVERWAAGPGTEDRMTIKVEVDERNQGAFLCDPHVWGVIYKQDLLADKQNELTGSERRKVKRRGSSSQDTRGFERRKGR